MIPGMKPISAGLSILAALTLAVTGCSTTPTDSSTAGAAAKITVMGEVYPLAWIAEQVGADRVSVSQIVPAGASAHGYELSPAQTDQVGKTSLVIYVKSLSTPVDEAVAQAKPAAAIDVATVIPTRAAVAHKHDDDEHASEDADHDAAGIDAHMWLNPATMPLLVTAVATELGTLDPTNKTTYEADAATLNEKFTSLDGEYKAGLSNCKQDTVIVTHPAFGYLTDQYGLKQVGISGFDEDTEPSPARLAEISKVTKEAGSTTIFFANTSNPKIAEVLADELKLKTQVLSTLTAAKEGQDYLTLSADNLTALRDGLGCS